MYLKKIIISFVLINNTFNKKSYHIQTFEMSLELIVYFSEFSKFTFIAGLFCLAILSVFFYLLPCRTSKEKSKLTQISITTWMKMAKKSWDPWKVLMMHSCYKDVWITWTSSGVSCGKSLSILGRKRSGAKTPEMNENCYISLIFLAQGAHSSYLCKSPNFRMIHFILNKWIFHLLGMEMILEGAD